MSGLQLGLFLAYSSLFCYDVWKESECLRQLLWMPPSELCPKIRMSLFSSNLLICIIRLRIWIIGLRNFELAMNCFCQAIGRWPVLISIIKHSLLVGSRKNTKLFRNELSKFETKLAEVQKKSNNLENKLQSNVSNQSR